LREGPRPGRPRRLAAPAWTKAAQDLQASPRALGYESEAWDGGLLAQHFRQVYGVQLGLRQCQRILQRLGMRPGLSQASL
jgi:transposase